MPTLEIDPLALYSEAGERARDLDQRSAERFDRMAFAERALALVHPKRTTVAICEGSRRVKVEAGRRWGGAPGERWAVLSVPSDASRRAIATAVLDLASSETRPWALDVLLNYAERP